MTVVILLCCLSRAHGQYAWKPASTQSLEKRIAVPEGYRRVETPDGSFAQWLRNIPLKPGKPDVMLYNGSPKWDQGVHYAVVDIDPGKKDLQQCADAVIRLRAEFLFASDKRDAISFHFTNGFVCDFKTWSDGNRPSVKGQQVSWKKSATPDNSYASFKKYLETVFTYSGTLSLSGELKAKPLSTISAGDVFIRGGSPGHAVIVMDVAEHAQTHERIFLLAQSYMPAQDIHILRNPLNERQSPWYSNKLAGELVTPEWTFALTALKHF